MNEIQGQKQKNNDGYIVYVLCVENYNISVGYKTSQFFLSVYFKETCV